jgi:hypothetical protein
MSMKKWTSGLVTAAGILLLAGCTEGLITGEGEDEEIVPEEEAPPPTDEDVVVSPHTRVLAPEAQTALVSYDEDSGTLVFDRSSAGVPAPDGLQISDPVELRVGDVVASGITEAAPHGLMRRITDIIEKPDGIEVLTVHAGLNEAIEHANVEMPLSLSGGGRLYPAEGFTVAAGPADRLRDEWPITGDKLDWSVPPNHDLFTGGRCIARALGGSVSWGAKFVINIDGATVKQFGLEATADASANADIECNHTDGVALSPFAMGEWIGAWQTSIGGVPFVFEFGAAAVGNVSSDPSNALKLTANWAEHYKAGYGYANGSWGPTYEHTSTAPTWDAKGSGRVRLNTGVVFMLSIYTGDVFNFFNWVEVGVSAGVTGTLVAVPFLELQAAQDFENGTGSATLFAGLESGAAVGAFLQVSVAVLGWEVWNQAWSWVRKELFPELKWELASKTY